MGVSQRLKKMKGVRTVQVDVKKKLGSVGYDPKLCKPADLVKALKEAGYPASVQK